MAHIVCMGFIPEKKTKRAGVAGCGVGCWGYGISMGIEVKASIISRG